MRTELKSGRSSQAFEELSYGAQCADIKKAAFRAVNELHDLVKNTPGAQALEQRFEWNKAFVDKEGFVTVPGRDGKTPLKLADDSRFHTKAGSGVYAITYAGVGIYFPELSESMDCNKLQGNLEKLGLQFKEVFTDKTARIWRISALLHETVHADNKKEVSDGDEFQAYRAQYQMLAASGVIQPVSDKQVLQSIIAYPPATFATAVMKYAKENPGQSLEDVVPGGNTFRTWMEACLKRNEEWLAKNPDAKDETLNAIAGRRAVLGADPWSSSYGKEFLQGVNE